MHGFWRQRQTASTLTNSHIPISPAGLETGALIYQGETILKEANAWTSGTIGCHPYVSLASRSLVIMLCFIESPYNIAHMTRLRVEINIETENLPINHF